MRAVIFGVDGLTFQVLHPLIERGDLPNFHRLSQQGCEAILESRYPPITPAAWMSLATGLKPAGHGVYDFWTYELLPGNKTTRKAHVVTHRKGGKAIWNILSEYGKRVLVINVPVTYPPEPVNGIMVSGYMTPNPGVNFTYPTAFKESLYQAVPNYKIDLEKEDMISVEVSGKADCLIDGILAMTERRIELTTHLLKNQPWDFCFVAFVGADRLQHPLWDDICALEPGAIEYFHLLDYGLGLILEQLGPDDCLFVVSDHGFQGVSRTFEINEYLYSQKLLRLNEGAQRGREHARRISNLKHTIGRLGLLSVARKAWWGLKATNALKEEFGDVSEPLDAGFDWEHTLACVPSYSCISSGYADIFFSPTTDDERIAELCADLKRQVDPQSGKALIEAIYTTEAFGSGPYAPREPHLLLLPNDGITFRLSLGNERFWDDACTMHDPSKRFGAHHKDGVLYAYGNGIKQGFNAPHAEVFDLVPTVLRSMGLPIPDGLDGRALDELFVASEQSEDRVMATANKVENDVVRRKLQKLLRS
jgi:predicted AlkP superfamily phosphohydrolase/phosphomutase